MNEGTSAILFLYLVFSTFAVTMWQVEAQETCQTLKLNTWGKLIVALLLLPGWFLYGALLLIAAIVSAIWNFLDKPIFKNKD